MINRPRLRPTFSRRTKYLTIAPRAERNLQREPRRGEHDLRRLVGHANFLDDLVDSLDPQSGGHECDSHAYQAGHTQAGGDLGAADGSDDDSSTANEVDGDDGDDDDDDWSDSSDDDEHSLVRTESGMSIVDVHVARAAQQETREAIAESDAVDYFSQQTQRSADLKTNEYSVADLKGASKISVYEVTSPSSDAVETLAVDEHHTKMEGN